MLMFFCQLWVHRGKLKSGKIDDRINFLNELQSITDDVKFDIYGINKIQPIWADHYFKPLRMQKWDKFK